MSDSDNLESESEQLYTKESKFQYDTLPSHQ